MKDAIIQAGADAIEKLSFPEGILPLGIEGRKIIAEAVFNEIKSHLAPPPSKVLADKTWTGAGLSWFNSTENAIYEATVRDGVALLVDHGRNAEIEAGATVEDAMRAAVEYDRMLTAVDAIQRDFPGEPVHEGDGPSIIYRMHDFDDWGVIRNRDGSVFATVSRPLTEGDKAAARESGSDPYEALGLLLVDAFERARSATYSDRATTLAVCAAVAEQERARQEIAAEDIRSSSWERTEARYRAGTAGDILAAIHNLTGTLLGERPHFDDFAVDRFAAAMKAKLAIKRADGYGGWSDPLECTTAFLSDLLVNHVNKGDPVDVGNFAMMIHQRGASIAGDRERYADMAKNRPHHKFEFPKRERLRERILAAPDDAEVEAGAMHPEAPLQGIIEDASV
jgi:hypothetical protein|nr:hypothetical protein [Neorhizobium tomejilense]